MIPGVRWASHLLWVAALLCGTMTVAGAAEDEPAQNMSMEPELKKEYVRPEGHELPPKGELVGEFREDVSKEIPGPETVIRLYEDNAGNQVREFVINGFTFQIEVTPYGGIPYYLLDTDGDGLFEVRTHADEPRLVVPQWILFRF